MIKKIEAYIRQYHMIQADDHVCVGVSGGADSVCLFRVLEQLRHRLGYTLSVVHIEHGIRGEESLADLKFVRQLSEAYGVSFASYAYPVEEMAKEQRCSVEEAGRNARYEAFGKEAALHGKNTKIALAHHANDNAETLLFHLCRGSGLDGLVGIRPVRDNVIRPLLCVTREEIEAFLKEIGQEYRTDATNADITYSRNRIRNCIVPLMEQVNAKAVLHMNRIAGDAAELSSYLDGEAGKILEAHRIEKTETKVCFSLAGFLKQPLILRQKVMLLFLWEGAGSKKDITREHVSLLLELAEGETGRQISLPYGMTAEKSYDTLVLSLAKEEEKDTFFSGHVKYRVFEFQKKDRKIPRNQYTKWFDYDKIKNGLNLRTREPGDFFIIDKEGHKQKLKDYWINEKIPRSARERALLLADGSHIVWAIGYRISEYYKVTEKTKRIVEVQYMEEGI